MRRWFQRKWLCSSASVVLVSGWLWFVGRGTAVAQSVTVPSAHAWAPNASAPPTPAASTSAREPEVFSAVGALEFGAIAARSAVRAREGIGPGLIVGLTGAAVFWDQLLVGAGAFYLRQEDRRPFTLLVVGCDERGENCTTVPEPADSTVSAALLRLELGYQHRFRTFDLFSLVPGIWLGHTLQIESMKRTIQMCVNCSGEGVDVDLSGAYVAPFFRVSFMGRLAVSVRSQWFLSGDLLHMTLVAVEAGMP